MTPQSEIYTALYSKAPTRAPAMEAPKEEAQLVDAVKANVLTSVQRNAVCAMIDQLRMSRATLEVMLAAEMPATLAAALRAADVYAGSTIAELRSTFTNYE